MSVLLLACFDMGFEYTVPKEVETLAEEAIFTADEQS